MDYQILRAGQTAKGYQKITISSSPVSLTVPEGANRALIIVENASVRFRDDGTSPTSESGMPLFQNQSMELSTKALLSKIKFIKKGDGNAVLNINYYEI